MLRLMAIAVVMLAAIGCGKKDESPRAKLMREAETLQDGQDAIVFDIGSNDVEVDYWGTNKEGEKRDGITFLRIGTKVRFLGRLEPNTQENPQKSKHKAPRAKILFPHSGEEEIGYTDLWSLKPAPK